MALLSHSFFNVFLFCLVSSLIVVPMLSIFLMHKDECIIMYPERPVIESMMSDQTVLQGGSAVLDCVSRGTPPLSVTWLHNALPLADDDQHIRFNSKHSEHFQTFLPMTFTSDVARGQLC